MSKQGLTPKREKFAQLVAGGRGQAEAYRIAFKAAGKNKTIHEGASRIAADSKVRARINELRAPVVAKVRYDLEHAMAEVNQAIRLAQKKGNASAMVQAVQLKAKLNGLMVEDRKNQRRPFEELSDSQLDGFIERTARDAGVTLQ